MKALAFLILASPAAALDLAVPFPATQTFLETQPLGSHVFATGAFDGTLPGEAREGAVTRRVLRLLAGEIPSLEVLAPIRDALIADGWREGYGCETAACGGFEFRFALSVTPAPEMFVNLADFRYLTLSRGDEHLELLVSPSGGEAYVQATHVGPRGSIEAVTVSSSNSAPPAPVITANSDIAATLVGLGRAVLDDLIFPPGSTDLPEPDYSSLQTLATFLKANPQTTIALVGHTDAEGGAEGNMAISERRARSAKAILTDTHGIAAARIDTFGVGFFAPIARNDTETGRASNRRVEVVITSTPDTQ